MDKSTLTPNNNNTVQPVALMRLTLKSLKNSKKNTLSRTDASLSLARAEGFDKVEITGPRDFTTWVGIIHSFARHNVILPFVEFAKLCGIPSSQSSRISPSLKRIAGTVISFSRTREYITHLVQSAYYDTERDADPRLFELYQFDRKVLLQPLKRRESAQALYTFIESLPISLARLRARLNLKSPVFSRRAMEQLREIGYLDYTEIQLFCIHYRRPRLKAPNDERPPSPAEKVSPEMAEKLALITLDDLEKLFKSR